VETTGLYKAGVAAMWAANEDYGHVLGAQRKASATLIANLSSCHAHIFFPYLFCFINTPLGIDLWQHNS
jgi:hypothetical protein